MRVAVPAWLLPLLASCCLPIPALAQQPPSGAWGGWARCVVTVQGPGYTDQQIHTWTISGGAPTAQGAFLVHDGTWSVVGRGSLSRSQGNQSFTAQWATNGPDTGGPIAVFVRASDNRMFIQARHAQLRSRGAIQGFQQVTIAGVPQTPGGISAEAFATLCEYDFAPCQHSDDNAALCEYHLATHKYCDDNAAFCEHDDIPAACFIGKPAADHGCRTSDSRRHTRDQVVHAARSC